MQQISRRNSLLSAAAALSAAVLTGPPAALGSTSPNVASPGTTTPLQTRRPQQFAVSTYSFWQFQREDLRSIDTCIDLAAEWGFDGVEILHRQMTDESNSTLQKIKQRAFVNGSPSAASQRTRAGYPQTQILAGRTPNTPSIVLNSLTPWGFPRCESIRDAGEQAGASMS